MFPGFLWVCLHKSWCLSTSKHTKWLRQESWIENQRLWSHINNFFYFGSNMLKAEWWTHVSYGLMSNNAKCICRKVGKRLRRPALHGFIIHCGTKSTWIATPNTLKNSYIRFLSKAQPHVNFMTQTPKSKPYFIKLPKYAVLIHSWVV